MRAPHIPDALAFEAGDRLGARDSARCRGFTGAAMAGANCEVLKDEMTLERAYGPHTTWGY